MGWGDAVVKRVAMVVTMADLMVTLAVAVAMSSSNPMGTIIMMVASMGLLLLIMI